MASLIVVDCMPGTTLGNVAPGNYRRLGNVPGSDRRLESGWSDEIDGIVVSRRCHRLDGVAVVVVSVAASVAAFVLASAVANIAVVDNSPHIQHQIHWNYWPVVVEIVVAAEAAVAPHSRVGSIAVKICYDCSVYSADCKPSLQNLRMPGGYY